MPTFMDVHQSMKGVTPDGLRAAHQADLDLQATEKVDFKRAWADPDSGVVFCLSEAPDAESIQRIHEQTGHPADIIYPILIEV